MTDASLGAMSETPAVEPAPAEPTPETTEPVLSRRAAREAEGRPARRRGIGGAIFGGIGIAVLVFLVAVAAVTVIVPRLTGATDLTVLTGSMRPGLPEGTLLIVKPAALSDIRIGDIITYEPKASDAQTLVTHRVIAVTTSTSGDYSFTTKGDANNTADPTVTAKQVVAKLWYSVPYLGWVSNFASGSGWLVPVGAIVLIIVAIWLIFSGNRDRGKQKQKAS